MHCSVSFVESKLYSDGKILEFDITEADDEDKVDCEAKPKKKTIKNNHHIAVRTSSGVRFQ